MLLNIKAPCYKCQREAKSTTCHFYCGDFIEYKRRIEDIKNMHQKTYIVNDYTSQRKHDRWMEKLIKEKK